MRRHRQLTLFQEDSRVNPFPLPGSDEAQRITETSGLKCLELYKRQGPLGLLARMLVGSSEWYSTKCFLIWRVLTIRRKRSLFRLVPLMPRTEGTEFGLWPTPRESEWKGTGPIGSASHEYRLGKFYLDATVQEETGESGPLNPEWVEWLMGYPIGWTDLKHSETP